MYGGKSPGPTHRTLETNVGTNGGGKGPEIQPSLPQAASRSKAQDNGFNDLCESVVFEGCLKHPANGFLAGANHIALASGAVDQPVPGAAR